MTAPPLPASPCVRCRLIWNVNGVTLGGSRLYFSYSGSAPTGANCTTLAGDIASAWNSHIVPLYDDQTALQEVDVLDIATDSGLSGQWTGSYPGAKTTNHLPQYVATNVEFGIARRYRGGKPRMYLPPGVATDQGTAMAWGATYIAAVNSGVAAFTAAIEALSIGAMGTLTHVNLSYYKGFTNHTTTSGREKAVPTYRDAALLDTITGYSCKAEMSTQKRRRTATTP